MLLATFLTIHFGEWRQHWHGMPGRTRTGVSMFSDVPRENEGALAVFDERTGQCMRWVTLDTPAGFVLGDDHIFVNSMHGNQIMCLDRSLKPVDSIALRLMSDLHSLTWSGPNLMVTSSGVDAVLEVTTSGDLVWSWFAREHGYAQSPIGLRPRVDRKADYRMRPAETSEQTTHCNSAVPGRVNGGSSVLVSLFHQGNLVAVDRETHAARTLVTGMINPHSVRPWRDGWLLCDSRAGAVVLLRDDFWVAGVIEADFNWVQDCIPLANDNLLIADANNSRFVEWSVDAEGPVRDLSYSDEWKIYQVEQVDGQWADWLRDG